MNALPTVTAPQLSREHVSELEICLAFIDHSADGVQAFIDTADEHGPEEIEKCRAELRNVIEAVTRLVRIYNEAELPLVTAAIIERRVRLERLLSTTWTS